MKPWLTPVLWLLLTVSFRQSCMNSKCWSGNVGAPRTR